MKVPEDRLLMTRHFLFIFTHVKQERTTKAVDSIIQSYLSELKLQVQVKRYCSNLKSEYFEVKVDI